MDKPQRTEHLHNGHSHNNLAALRNENKSRLTVVLVITGLYMLVEVIVACFTHSLALFADAGHMLSDVAALLLALLAFWFSSRPSTLNKSYGYYRSEILAGLINGVLLVVISLFILLESYARMFHPPHVVSGPVIVVAVFGLIVNFTSIRLLSQSAENSVNVKAAYLEVLGDLFATIGVLISGAVIYFTGWNLADPIVSAGIGLMILPRTWILLSECVNILMEGSPAHLNLADLRSKILAVNGVVDLHDIHVWSITSGFDAMSGHVGFDEHFSGEAVLKEVTRICQEDFGITHTTIQVEKIECTAIGVESKTEPQS